MHRLRVIPHFDATDWSLDAILIKINETDRSHHTSKGAAGESCRSGRAVAGMVDAALIRLDRGELGTIPSLHDA